jgi:hypothetical protein
MKSQVIVNTVLHSAECGSWASRQLQDALRRDYEKMREMYFGQEPDFDAVINDIRELEEAFNERQ